MSVVKKIPFEEAFVSSPVGKLKIKESEYDSTGSICVVDQGQSLISGMTNRADLIRDDGPYIVFGDHTRIVKFIDFPFVVGADGVRLYKASEKFEPKFLYLFLKSSKLPEDGYGRHSKYLKELFVPEVSKDKQRQIAARLKAQLAEVETARQAARVQLSELTVALNRAIEHQIKEVISSSKNMVKLGEVAGISAKLVQPEQEEYADLPHVSAENIESITGRLLNIRSAKEDGMISGKYLFDAGDILYSKLRPYLRKVARPSFGGLCSADMYPIKTNESLVSMDFLKLLLISNFFTDYANEKSARSRMPKLNREQLFDFEFSLPSLEKQAQCVKLIGSFMELSEQAINAAKCILKDIEKLPARILAQAFEN